MNWLDIAITKCWLQAHLAKLFYQIRHGFCFADGKRCAPLKLITGKGFHILPVIIQINAVADISWGSSEAGKLTKQCAA